MKQPTGRAPKEIGAVKLREIERGGRQHPWKVRLEWRDQGKRRYRDENNWPHAEARARQIDNELNEGIHVADGATITFAKAWKAWLAHSEQRHRIGDLGGATLANYRWASASILAEFERKKLNKITASDVEKWLMAQAETYARHTVDNKFGYLLVCLDYCVRQKWLKRNPLRDERVRVPGRRQKRVDIPTYDDIERLIQLFGGPRPSSHHAVKWSNRKILFALAAFAGLRAGEIAALNWDAVDLPNARLRIVEGAGTHSPYDGLKSPKTEAGIRTIPICQYLHDALMDYASTLGDREGYVFRRKHGGLNGTTGKQLPSEGPISSQEISDSHRETMRIAGLVKPDGHTIAFSTHALRHWHASASLEIGVKLLVVSKRMGHSQPSITTDIYGHVLDDEHDDPGPIWHERLARARPDRLRLIEGGASGPLIEGTAFELISEEPDARIPTPAPPWVPAAIRLLEGGWRVADVARHLGQHRTTINAAFARLGLAAPDQFRIAARDRRYQEFYDQGFTDAEIATRTNTHPGTVLAWRTTMERDKPNTRKSLILLQKERSAGGGKATKMRQKQLNLL